MNLIIRQAEERDIVTMAELDKACFDSPWSKHSFAQELIENNLAFYIVAEAEGILVGYAGLWGILEEGHITNVAVHPDFRKKGVGESLVSILIEYCQTQGITRYTLEVRASNDAAISLYSKLGFIPKGRRKKYYQDNQEDAIIMWRTE